MFSGFYLTTNGQRYMSAAIGGKNLVLTKGEFGSGQLPSGSLPVSATALTNKLGDMPISEETTTGTQFQITTQFSNRVNGSILPAFYLTEMGVFGKVKNSDGTDDPNYPETLIFYAYVAQAQADYIPATLTEYIVNWPIQVSASTTVTVTIDQSLVYPTTAQTNAALALKQNKITATGILKGDGSGGVTAAIPGVDYNGALTNNITLYVATTGNDTTGDGTQANPYKTIQKAVNQIPKQLNGYTATINISSGTYNETVTLQEIYGIVYLNGAQNAAVQINRIILFNSHLRVTNISLTLNSGNNDCISGNIKSVFYSEKSIVMNGNSGITTNGGLVILIGGITLNVTSDGVSALNNGEIYVTTVSGSAGTTFYARQGGVIRYNSESTTSGIKLLTATGGRIYSGSQAQVPSY